MDSVTANVSLVVVIFGFFWFGVGWVVFLQLIHQLKVVMIKGSPLCFLSSTSKRFETHEGYESDKVVDNYLRWSPNFNTKFQLQVVFKSNEISSLIFSTDLE